MVKTWVFWTQANIFLASLVNYLLTSSWTHCAISHLINPYIPQVTILQSKGDSGRKGQALNTKYKLCEHPPLSPIPHVAGFQGLG